MINYTATIQELTLQLYDSDAWEYFYNEQDMSRDQIFNMVENWAREFDKAYKSRFPDTDYYDEIDRFLAFCISENKAGRFPKAEEYLHPRIQIEIFVTEDGHAVHETLEYPKRDVDIKGEGSEYEWYYSIAEVHDKVMALPVGGSMNFKIRDEVGSHGTILRTE